MSKQRRTYTVEFKQELIWLYESIGRSMTEIERGLGIAPGLLNMWRACQRSGGEEAFPGVGQRTEAEVELHRLKWESDILRASKRFRSRSEARLAEFEEGLEKN